MIHITKKAEHYLKVLISKQIKKKNLRITILYPGTERAECKISYDVQKTVLDKDIELKYDGFSIYIRKNIAHYFYNAKIDLLGDQIHQKLMLLAPNATNRITSDHKSNNIKEHTSLINKIRYFIDTNINPMLNMHGGKIILVDITETGCAMIKFLGGCNGCTMSHVTFKKSIEKQILHHFPSLHSVQDITRHNHGIHSFF